MFENETLRNEKRKENDEFQTVEHFMDNSVATRGWFWFTIILILQILVIFWIVSFVVRKSVRRELYDFRSKTMSF